MNKKFFIGLFLISLIIFNGGCGGSNKNSLVSPVTNTTDVNEALKGAWTSSNNGTATITNTDAESDDLNAFIEAFGEIPAEVLQEYQQSKTDESVTLPVTRVMTVFEDCNIAENSGTAKLTAIIILSDDSSYWPILFNGVSVSTQRNNTNEWTATIPDAGTLSVNMASEEKINLSGKIRYLDYDCEFNTVINKNQSNSINPATILDGTWNLDGTQGGGYFSDNSAFNSAVVPENVSLFFSGTGEENSSLKSNVISFYSLRMKTSTSESEETSLLQTLNPDAEGKLTQISGSVYKFTETNGKESIILIENTDEIFMFKTESADEVGQACIFLPLKKEVSFDIESAMKKSWSASDGDGGGYLNINLDSDDSLSLIKTFSVTLKNGTINFSDVTLNDDGTITSTIALDTILNYTNEMLESFGYEDVTMPVSDTSQYTMTRSGNFLQFEDNEGGTYKLSFISDKELFFYTKVDNAEMSGEFAMRFTAE